MNTATCHICKRPDVPLDDSGRLEPHRMYPFKSINNPMCENSGSFPQAPDGAEKLPQLAPPAFYAKDASSGIMVVVEIELYDRLATLHAQAREKIAGLEKALEQLKPYAHCNCPADEDGEVRYHSNCNRHMMPIITSALDAARDKKGTK